ncbi:MAG: YceI family protein [Bacteroidia bacterium]
MSTTKWALDATHSEVQFKVKHLMISTVTGSFKKFDASVETNGEDFTTAKINFSADIDSITTNNEQRDGHLKTGDFFDAAAHPQIKFESTKLEKATTENHKLHGNFTIKGVTKPVVLDVEFGGIAKDPWGNTRAGFSINGKINRQDYGISFGAVTETGGLVVSNDVSLHSNIEFVKQA